MWRVARVEEAMAATSSMCSGSWVARRVTSSIICNFNITMLVNVLIGDGL